MTKYARDEFDRIPEAASRQGVHRAASAPVRRRLWPILAVGILALAIGLVSFLILPTLGFSQAGSQASTSVESAASPETSAAPLATTGASPSAEPTQSTETENSEAVSSDAGTPDAEPSAGASTPPSAAVLDKAQGVAIYNAAGTAGLAGRISAMVQADGWSLGEVGNWGGAPQQTSIVFYASAAEKANAEAISTLLGIPTLVQSPDFQVPVVVVLGPDYR